MTKKFMMLLFTIAIIGAMGLPASADMSRQDISKDITIGMNAPNSLDPLSVSRFDTEKRDLLDNLYMGLTRFDSRLGQVVPYLAEEWSVSPDGLFWTFTLREDVMWMQYDGSSVSELRPVAASDVVFSIQRACDPNRPDPVVASNLAIIRGCSDISERRDVWNIDQDALDATIGVRALDDLTVEFELLFPASFFLTLTTMPEFRPLPSELVGDGAYPFGNSIATNGAWVLETWDSQHMSLVPNETWPLEREGNVERIDIRFDLNGDSIVSRLASGTLAAARVTPSMAQSIEFSNPDAVRSSEKAPLTLIGFSLEYDVVNNPLFRQALSIAIDREQVIRTAESAAETNLLSTTRFVPRTAIATTSASGLAFDATQAQNLLSQAGYANCADVPQLTLAVANDQKDIAIGQAVIQQWQQNLGCAAETFQLVVVSRQELINNAHLQLATEEVGRYTMWISSWTADYPDVDGWLTSALHCDFGFFRVGRACDINDELLIQAGSEEDITQRVATYTQVENAFFGFGGSFPVIPVVIESDQWVVQPWLTNVGRYGTFQFDRWIIEDE